MAWCGNSEWSCSFLYYDFRGNDNFPKVEQSCVFNFTGNLTSKQDLNILGMLEFTITYEHALCNYFLGFFLLLPSYSDSIC